MVKQEQDCELGTEELERGLRPAAAFDFAKIATMAVALLLVFNSTALVDWTRQSRPGPVIAALEAPALRWHAAWCGWARRGFSSVCARSRGSFS